MKKVITLILALTILLSVGAVSSAATPNEISVLVNGEKIIFDQPPEAINGRTMIPVRFVVEKLGCNVEWDSGTQTVYINAPNLPLVKNATNTGAIKVYVNNKPVSFPDEQPVAKNGRTLIPIRFVVEKLGCTVGWNNGTQTATIDSAYPLTAYKVLRVIDGDTIEIDYNGAKEKVRFIGVDTPESVHPDSDKNIEYGKIASEFTSKYLSDQYVALEFDVQERDMYGRLLAYVYYDGVMFNKTLLEYGHAQVATYPPNVKYVDDFVAIQATARDKGVGFWAYEPADDGGGGTGGGVPTSGNVYIPNSGTKYHSTATCSNMKNPSYVTLEYAISRGFTACSKCW